MRNISKIGVLTSGGDAPGMNAAVRAVVRTAAYYKIDVVGIRRGYQGLLEEDFINLTTQSMSKTIATGGTIIKSARCLDFHKPEVRKVAYENLRKQGIDALVVIGGDGSFRGATALYNEFALPVVGIPGTIDNDIYGTDFTIGYDTAINTAMECIDKIRDTAESHNYAFFVEVMGRHSGFIAISTGIAVGAEVTLIPEVETTVEELCQYLHYERRSSKSSALIIVAEGNNLGNAVTVAAKVKEQMPDYHTRIVNLGHVQRGGSPTCADRNLASILGYEAVVALLDGQSGIMVGQQNGKTVHVDLNEVCNNKQIFPKHLHKVARVLSM